VEFEQPLSLDELTVRWVGGDAAEGELEIDDYEGTPPAPDADEPPPAESVTDADIVALSEDIDFDPDRTSVTEEKP
jgi:segregation and condensation protein A